MTINVGDKIPSVGLATMGAEGPEGISTDDIFSGKKVVIFGLPGAFTPTCSAKHLPGFVEHADAITAKGVDTIACISVNDAFVMGAWGKDQNVGDNVMMLADGNGQLEQVIDTGEKLIDEYAGTPSAAHGIILLANRYYRVGRYDEAEKLYERYIAEYGESQALLFAARTGVAACHEATGDLEGAATGYVAYADAHPNDRASAIALMDAARCYRVLGDTQQQGAVLGRVTRDFPTSPAAQRARQELQML